MPQGEATSKLRVARAARAITFNHSLYWCLSAGSREEGEANNPFAAD